MANKYLHDQLEMDGEINRTERMIKEASLEADNTGIILDRARFPKYATLESRIKSYGSWNSEFSQNPVKLSEAGFAYTGTGDAVRCYFCGGGLRHWRPDDCPWREHAYHYRHCGHVRQCKGDMYVRCVHGEIDYQSNSEDATADLEELGIVSDAIQNNPVAIEAAKEFYTDMDENKLKAAVKHIVSSEKKLVFTAMDVVNALDEIKEDVENICRPGTPGMLTDKDEIKESRDELEKAYEELKQPLLCKICLEANACVITLPCGHMCSCPQCISALSHCAVCRENIKGTVRAFMSLYN